MASDSPRATDGRLQRSERSRAAIVEALLELVGSGVLMPTAQQVAARAGVGIRTVFRHFSDMETLFAAMAEQLRDEGRVFLEDEPGNDDLAARARALVQRRTSFYERMAPYQRSTQLQRWRSPFLQRNQGEWGRALRRDLLRWLPELAEAEPELCDAVQAVTSFATWEHLRSEQGLGAKRTTAAIDTTVAALTADLSNNR